MRHNTKIRPMDSFVEKVQDEDELETEIIGIAEKEIKLQTLEFEQKRLLKVDLKIRELNSKLLKVRESGKEKLIEELEFLAEQRIEIVGRIDASDSNGNQTLMKKMQRKASEKD